MAQVILFEGLPGSGKSTTGQQLHDHLRGLGVESTLLSEEMASHPIYLFQDRDSMNALLAELAAGHHEAVVGRAVAHWRAWAGAARDVTILDSCLFGYLTWTLYPHYDADAALVRGYVRAVVQAIAPLDPAVVYFRPGDLAAGLRRIADLRGPEVLDRYVKRFTGSPFCRARGLEGFDGMVAYWRAWTEFVDAELVGLPFPTLRLDTFVGDWADRARAVTDLLGLPPIPSGRIDDNPATT